MIKMIKMIKMIYTNNIFTILFLLLTLQLVPEAKSKSAIIHNSSPSSA